jgi:hypothetical protein
MAKTKNTNQKQGHTATETYKQTEIYIQIEIYETTKRNETNFTMYRISNSTQTHTHRQERTNERTNVRLH